MSADSRMTVPAFLGAPGAYPEATREVTTVETHMSWVFLTDSFVYKLKKPITLEDLDFSSPELRKRNCEDEVRLNRRLAPDVYLGVVPLTEDPDGGFSLGGIGRAVDWLVRMRRLPSALNLDTILRAGSVRSHEPDIRRAAAHLARFYATASPETVSPGSLVDRLSTRVHADRCVLSQPRYRLPLERVLALTDSERAFLTRCARLFERRAEQGRIVEGHGDLRPEHIWVGDPPSIIDCVEFDRRLRTLDAADDLAFLGLECERLGHPEVGQWFWDAYTAATGDAPPRALVHFYRVHRAVRRAVIAVTRLDEPGVVEQDRFLARARRYLEMVEPLEPASPCTW
jgi:uncharacterized protein